MTARTSADLHQRIDTLFQTGTLGARTDRELLEQFLAGPDTRASASFRVLVDRHGSMVLRLCQRVLDDQHEAEDAAQATFLILARRARSIRRKDSVASWLFGVTLRVARKAQARSHRRRKRERLEGDMSDYQYHTGAQANNPAPDPLWAELSLELERLPETLRAPLILCYFEGLTHEQAAHHLGMSLRTLRRRLAQGRDRLKARLLRRGLAPSASPLSSTLVQDTQTASPPPVWIDQTVRAALEFSQTGAAAGAAAPLAHEVLQAMFHAKLRLVLTSSLVIGTLTLASLIPLALAQKGSENGPKTPPQDVDAPAETFASPPLPDFVTARPHTHPARSTTIQVLDASTGKPAPFAHVRVWKAMLDDWRTADADGRITIEHSSGPADTRFGVDVWADGLAMQRHNYEAGDDPIPDETVIKLHPGESLGGLVVDEQNRPVSGASVFLWSHNYEKADPSEILYDLRATTGPDGRWHTGGAPRTTGDLLGFYITHPDYISDQEYASGRAKPPIAELRAETAVSVLKKGVPIEGRVLDADGHPVAGALVLSINRPTFPISEAEDFSVLTGPNGHFRTGQVAPGNWLLFARAPHHAPGYTSVQVETAIPQVEIRLGKPRSLTFRVQNSEGQPLPGAFLNIASWRQFRGLGIYLWTNADGLALWNEAPSDRIQVGASLDGRLSVYNTRVEPTDGEFVLSLPPSLRVTGTVLDTETGKPIPRAAVEVGAVDLKSGEVLSWTSPSDASLRVDHGALTAFFAARADAYKLRIYADGYEPFLSRTFRSDERSVSDYKISLRPLAPETPRATALLPDGTPLANALILVGRRNRQDISLKNGKPWYGMDGLDALDHIRQLSTAPDGSFPIPDQDTNVVLFLINDSGYAYATPQTLKASPKLRAYPFARVEGRYLIGNRPGAHRPLRLSGHLQTTETNFATIFSSHETTTDTDGRFTFDRVIPLPNLRVARIDPPDTPDRIWTNGETVSVEPGQTAHITYGGSGRPVLGQVAPPEDWTEPVDFTREGTAHLVSNRARTPFPVELLRGKTLQDPQWSEWMETWSSSPEGRAYEASIRRDSVALAPDGSFRIDDVPPGDYRLIVQVNEKTTRDPGPFAPLSRLVSVSPNPEDRPIDLGLERLRRRSTLKPGDPAPKVEITTVDGKPLSIPDDFRNRYLLLDFGAPYSDQSRLQVLRLNALTEKLGPHANLSILSLVVAPDTPDTRQFIADKGQPWPQAIVGPFPNPITEAFGIEDAPFGVSRQGLPRLILISPDGTILRTDVYGKEVETVLTEALRKGNE